jgi:hypothetical protein
MCVIWILILIIIASYEGRREGKVKTHDVIHDLNLMESKQEEGLTSMFTLMRSGLDMDVNLVPLRQAPQKSYADAQAFIHIKLR